MLIKNALEQAANHRLKQKKKVEKKYLHCEKKIREVREEEDFRDIPRDAWEILNGVNLFRDKNITPEQSADPMICSPSISLNQDELSFLRKGPRFMLRQEINDEDFKVELEKMSVKEKFNDNNKETDNNSFISDDSLSEEADKEAAKTAMAYLKSEKIWDLGKIKATDY